MKKPLLLIAAVLALVSCAKTIEVTGGGTEASTDELTLNTIANPTKAIAEGTEVPTDNTIGLLPNFKSDIDDENFTDYNNLMTFGYDHNRKVWRGLGEYEQDYPFTKSLMDDIQQASYTFSPYYWPSGNRVYMDYVAYSNSNLINLMLQLLDRYGLRSALDRQMESTMGKLDEVLDMLLVVDPYTVSPNQLNVYYVNNMMTYLAEAFIAAFDGPVLSPIAVGAIIAMCVAADIPTGFETVAGQPMITLADLDAVVECLITTIAENRTSQREAESATSKKEAPEKKTSILDKYNDIIAQIPAEIQGIWEQVEGAVDFIKDYALASVIMSESYNDYERSEALKEYDMTQEHFDNVMNRAYYLCLTRLPLLLKYAQDDLLYAYDRGLRNTNGGQIKAAFNHSKAWVKVLVNNMTDNDILIGITAFENIHPNGTLVIDNSRSLFEAYWDFTKSRPYHPEEEDDEGDAIGIIFEDYTPATLDGESVSMDKKKNPLTTTKADIGDSETMLEKIGIIPGMYFVPSKCYGPAMSTEIQRSIPSSLIEDITQPVTEESGEESGEETEEASETKEILAFKCLKGDASPSENQIGEMARNVSGAMFPSQETAGQVHILYYSITNEESQQPLVDESGYVVETRDVSKLVNDMKAKNSDDYQREVTLNLPRVRWEMGKVYIYVINITDSEISIEPHLTDWQTQMVASEEEASEPLSIEGLEIDEDASGWFPTQNNNK